MARRNLKVLKWTLVIALLVVVPWIGWKLFLRQHHLSFLPGAMGVSKILYVAEESWGFGPGGNETGIIVYEMPDDVTAALKAGGLTYLSGLPRQPTSNWQGVYANWRETPIVPDDQWLKSHNEGSWQWTSPGIGDFMFRYGFAHRFDEGIEKMVNDAIFKPGSFYAFGRIGLIVLIPAERRIVYAYNG